MIWELTLNAELGMKHIVLLSWLTVDYCGCGVICH